MPDLPENDRKVCSSCGHLLDLNYKGPCPYCGDTKPPRLEVSVMDAVGFAESGETTEERWIENRNYQALLIALIVIPTLLSVLMQSWIPFIIGLIADIIAYFIGDRARYKERTIRPF